MLSIWAWSYGSFGEEDERIFKCFWMILDMERRAWLYVITSVTWLGWFVVVLLGLSVLLRVIAWTRWISFFQKREVSTIVKVFSVFTNYKWSKLEIVTIHWIKSRIWDTIDDWYVNNLAKNQVFALFHVSCLCPSEGHKHGGRKVTETSVIVFCYWNENLLLWRSDTLK